MYYAPHSECSRTGPACMYICININLCTCLICITRHIHTYIHTFIHTHRHHPSVFVEENMYKACIYIFTHTHTHTHAQTHAYSCTYACTYKSHNTHAHTQMFMYTHSAHSRSLCILSIHIHVRIYHTTHIHTNVYVYSLCTSQVSLHIYPHLFCRGWQKLPHPRSWMPSLNVQIDPKSWLAYSSRYPGAHWPWSGYVCMYVWYIYIHTCINTHACSVPVQRDSVCVCERESPCSLLGAYVQCVCIHMYTYT
jgi:hypothetical protein